LKKNKRDNKQSVYQCSRQVSNGYTRYQFLDFTRGIAIILMFIYHLSFGLAHLGYFDIHFSTDIVWITFRAIIVFLFLSLVGIGLHLTTRNKLNLKTYSKRLLLLFIYFSSITLLSQFVRPDTTVYFGILHLIFVSSLLGLFFINLRTTNIVIGLLVIFIGLNFQSHYFDSAMFNWTGLSYITPISDDFAPLFPWFGLVLIGIFIGQWLFKRNTYQLLFVRKVLDWKANIWFTQLICWAGRYSIHLYVIHFQLFYILVYLYQ
jgi:uncharacterized membrane protein